jgi:hypothetical protein
MEVVGKHLVEALRLGGWMLAHQTLTAASGKIPMPLIAFAHDGVGSPELLAPRADSELYDVQVAAGRILASDMGSQARHLTFAYDRDLEDSGRALVVEVGVGEPLHRITFGQRYVYDNEAGLRLIGDLHLVGQEFLPHAVQKSLEPLRWRDLLTEGAADHDLAGQQWRTWYAARDHEQVRLRLGGFSLTVPEDWLFRRTQDSEGWVMARLLPWECREFEPTIITLLVTYSDQATLEEALENKKSQLINQGVEVLKAEIVGLASPALSSKAAFLAWNGEGEGRSFRAEWVWVPTGELGHFLLLCVVSFYEESWEDMLCTVKELLATLNLADRGGGAESKVDGHAKLWLGKLLQKLRRK